MGCLDLTGLLDETIDWQYKAFPPTDHRVTIGTAGEQGWNALQGDLLFPVLVLKEPAMNHNIALMARYCTEHRLSHAPHGKTPMAPQIVDRQLAAGVWGISAATIAEVRVFRAFGVQRIFLANELLEPVGIRWLAEELAQDRELDFYCLADSQEGVRILQETLAAVGLPRPMKVLVEMGVEGGRAGCRDADEALTVARAIEEASCLALAGVEGYEGAVPGAHFAERLAGVDRFFQQVRELACAIDRAGLFEDQEILVSAGGSIFFDRVVQQLGPPWQLSRPVRVVIRPGSYVTHDADLYRRISPLDGRSSNDDRLRPALEILGLVLSRPEPGIAIAGIGKRDAPYDTRLPIPTRVWRTGVWRDVAGRMTVTQLNDQHAFLALAPEDDLRPGDVVACDISHPCTTFDKWRLIPLVDDDYQVTGAIKTFF